MALKLLMVAYIYVSQVGYIKKYSYQLPGVLSKWKVDPMSLLSELLVIGLSYSSMISLKVMSTLNQC